MLKVYLASGWFRPGEGEQEERVFKSLCKNKSLDIFSPRRNQLADMSATTNQKDKLDQFLIDCDEIDKADIIIADYTFRDSGTIWEIGYAFKANKPILIYDNIELNKKKPNLMIALCAKLGYINDWSDFEIVVKNLNKDNYNLIDVRLNKQVEVE